MKLKKHINLIFSSLILLTIFSCGKDDSNDTNNPENPVDIYVVGRIDSPNGDYIAKVWKDGIPTVLSDNATSSVAQDILVSGNDIYIVGSEILENHSVARIWKNGLGENLSESASDLIVSVAYGVAMDGNEVYACGYGKNSNGKWIAAYWNGGHVTPLSDGLKEAFSYDIEVKNNIVYVVGNIVSESGLKSACIWKNGVLTELTDGSYFASAQSIFVEGNDVYVAGFEDSDTKTIAKVWKNGIAMPLSANESYAQSIKVVNGVVYVVGWEHINNIDQAVLWKNGVPTYLTNGDRPGIAVDLCVKGDDIYVVGKEADEVKDLARIKVWKNGESMTLTPDTENAYATGIVVVNQ